MVYKFSTLILDPRGHDPSGLRQESRPLAASKTGSPRFTDSLSNMTNLIGCKTQDEYSAHAQKLGASRGLDSWRRPEGSRPLGTRMLYSVLGAGELKSYFKQWAPRTPTPLVPYQRCSLGWETCILSCNMQ